MNANDKLLDVWMLISCGLCGRTSKVPVHERIHVQELESDRPMVGALAGKAAYHDWSGTWELETGIPCFDLQRADPAPLQLIIRLELPVPIRVEKLLAAGFGLSRSAVRRMVDSGRIRLPMAIDAKAREDFTLVVITTPTAVTRRGSGSGGAPVGPEAAAAAAYPPARSRRSGRSALPMPTPQVAGERTRRCRRGHRSRG